MLRRARDTSVENNRGCGSVGNGSAKYLVKKKARDRQAADANTRAEEELLVRERGELLSSKVTCRAAFPASAPPASPTALVTS